MNEKAFLGLLLDVPKYFNVVRNTGNIFYDTYCRKMFDTMIDLHSKGISINPKNIENTNAGFFQDEVIDLMMQADTPDSFTMRFDYFKKHFAHRSIQHVLANYQDKYENYDQLRNEIEKSLYFNTDTIEGVKTIKEIHVDLIQKTDSYKKKIGLEFFDRYGGIRLQHLIIIGARPKTGKTSIGIHLTKKALWNNYKVGFFNMELDNYDFDSKLLANITDIDSNAIYDKKLTKNQELIVAGAMDETSKKDLLVWSSKMNVNQICRAIKQAYKNHGTDIFIIDHLHHIKRTIGKTTVEQLEYITSALAELKKELGIIIILLAQLNRDAQNTEPKISDLKGCGDIEQLADLIILLHERNQINLIKSNLDLYVTNRFGPSGKLYTVFEKNISKIREINNNQ